MYRTYLTIAQRTLLKNRTFSLINALGIALSLTAFLFILQYTSFERGFNGFHARLPQLYRVLQRPPVGEAYAFTQAPLAATAQRTLPDVQDYCRVLNGGTAAGVMTCQQGNELRSFREKTGVYADPGLFRMFSFPVLEGKPTLDQPRTVAISATYRRKYFGTQPALGKILTLTNQFGKTAFTVTAVFADLPAQSDIQFDMAYSLATLATPAGRANNDWADLDAWGYTFLQSYVQLAPGADANGLGTKLTALLRRNQPQNTEAILLQPLRYVHLAPHLGDPLPTESNLGFVYLIGSIGLLILCIAWLNYINLSTATSLKRAKEVGIRKVAGATRWQLVGQFLGESVLLNGLGLGLALLGVTLLQPFFNDLTGKPLSLRMLGQDGGWGAGLGLVVVGLVLSGGYVAVVLSSLPMAASLKGSFVRSGRGNLLRKSLVVFQFTVSTCLIMATLLIFRQLHYLKHRDLGMNIAQVLVVKGAEGDPGDTTRGRVKEAFRNELAALPFVNGYCGTGNVPGGWYNFSADGVTRPSPRPGEEKVKYNFLMIDQQYLPTYQIARAAGQNFTSAMCEKSFAGDKLMLNEKAALAMGFASATAAVGQKVRWGSENESKRWEVVGVVKDYNHQSLRQPIEPVVYIPQNADGFYSLRLGEGSAQSHVARLEKLYRQYFPSAPFEYFFADENYDKQYKAQDQFGRIFTVAASLAIFISCLGLFGLATFSTEQKTKEIGIRKVLGASVGSIVALLSRDFLKLVLFAFVVATPLAWWAMNRWLQDFAYRTDLAWWIFAAAGGAALLIALLTVGYQAIRAATANPVKSLRTE